MPIPANGGKARRGRGYRVPGAFRSLPDQKRRAVAEIDERAERIGRRVAEGYGELAYVVEVDARERAKIMRRIEAMERGESELFPVADVRRLPGAEGVPFVAPVDLYEVTSEEYAQTVWQVRVFSDDVVTVGQTRDQFRRQTELIAEGYWRGRFNDEGDWQPIALNPQTGEWRDIAPGDVVKLGGSVTEVADGTFTQTDSQRVENLFNPGDG
jgi:hypothetical protein